jgi:catechol 2,3-dioxygenase-like lactoylglutathione lyase family enzyme
MIDYVTLGTNDLARATAFYDEIAKILGHTRMFETERMTAWGTPEKSAMMGVITPLDGEPATHGNGSMFGLKAEREEQVHQIYDHAMANGGSDEGPPGPRGDQFYAAYFRDPDGNKLLAYLLRG